MSIRTLLRGRPGPADRRSRACRPAPESLEVRLALSTAHATVHAEAFALPSGYTAARAAARPVLPPAATTETATFVDPTAVISRGTHVGVKEQSYIAPFAILLTGRNTILLGQGSNIQDNVMVDARGGDVTIGDNDPIAHDATIIGPARIGAPGGKPAFMSFNSVVDGATLEPDTIVSGLARVGPGVVIHSGTKVLPGKFVRTQAEADDPALGKVGAVTAADRAFVQGVLAVNHEFASGYTELFRESPRNVRGVGPNPNTPFNPGATLPTLGGQATQAPGFRNRIIGKATLADTLSRLSRILGLQDAIRADEGHPFVFGRLGRVRNKTTFHALEGTGITVGQGDFFGFHDVIHGGPDVPNADPSEITILGDDIAIGDFSVVYRSTVGNNARIGHKVYIDKSNVAAGAVIPDGTILINNKVVGTVEW